MTKIHAGVTTQLHVAIILLGDTMPSQTMAVSTEVHIQTDKQTTYLLGVLEPVHFIVESVSATKLFLSQGL